MTLCPKCHAERAIAAGELAVKETRHTGESRTLYKDTLLELLSATLALCDRHSTFPGC